jgi:hypothetical protein
MGGENESLSDGASDEHSHIVEAQALLVRWRTVMTASTC